MAYDSLCLCLSLMLVVVENHCPYFALTMSCVAVIVLVRSEEGAEAMANHRQNNPPNYSLDPYCSCGDAKINIYRYNEKFLPDYLRRSQIANQPHFGVADVVEVVPHVKYHIVHNHSNYCSHCLDAHHAHLLQLLMHIFAVVDKFVVVGLQRELVVEHGIVHALCSVQSEWNRV